MQRYGICTIDRRRSTFTQSVTPNKIKKIFKSINPDPFCGYLLPAPILHSNEDIHNLPAKVALSQTLVLTLYPKIIFNQITAIKKAIEKRSQTIDSRYRQAGLAALKTK